MLSMHSIFLLSFPILLMDVLVTVAFRMCYMYRLEEVDALIELFLLGNFLFHNFSDPGFLLRLLFRECVDLVAAANRA